MDEHLGVGICAGEDFAGFEFPIRFGFSFTFALFLLRTTAALARVDVGDGLLDVELGAFVDGDVHVAFVASRSFIAPASHGICVVSPYRYAVEW